MQPDAAFWATYQQLDIKTALTHPTRTNGAAVDPEKGKALQVTEDDDHASAGDCQACGHLIFGNPLNILLVSVPFGVAAPRLGWGDEVIFALNFIAILPLAGILGTATEELAGSVGETLGGLLNATFGNAVEMILSVFALREGLVDVVQGSLLGSILSNLLLVLGMCFALGGMKYHTQKYNGDGARTQASLLLLSVLALVMPSLAGLTVSKKGVNAAQETELFISRGAAIILGVLYCLYLCFQLGTHRECFQAEDEGESEETTMSAPCAVVILIVVTLVVAMCSEGLVGSVEGMTEKLGVSRSFIGTVLLPIVGNAAEHATAVTVAWKDKMDLSLGVALGSSAQIALLVVPFTVIVGWIIDVPMDLNFHPVNTGILLITVLIVGMLTSDGESNWLEGAMLLAAYLLVGVTFWFIE
mmetsp:Transcript_105095/g.338940  ORF Transcript_105095/g.338940 Transcript_105095/m.338940 type:complete len:415 (-) Transcript_105095:217-1461(-)